MSVRRTVRFSARTDVRRRLASGRGVRFLVVGFLCLSLFTCDTFDFYGVISGKPSGTASGPLAISPVSATVTVDATLTFTASGGTPPYRFSVTGSGTIDPGTGIYRAPALPSSDAVQVSDSVGGVAEARVSVLQ